MPAKNTKVMEKQKIPLQLIKVEKALLTVCTDFFYNYLTSIQKCIPWNKSEDFCN